MAKEKKNNNKNKILANISKVIWVLSIIMMFILGYFIYEANILPFKYYMIVLFILVVLLSIHGILVLKKSTRNWVLVIISVLAIFLIGVEGFATFKINDTLTFLKKNLGAYFETNVYNIVVNKNASYESISDIENKNVMVYQDMDDMEELEKAINKKTKLNITYDTDVSMLLENVKNDEELIVIVNSGNYDAMVEMDKDFEDSVKILDTINITVELEQEATNLDITKEPFVVYLSGIDTRSGYLPARSLSDVNMILAVNPKKKDILMIHIPRDYYVQIHGTTGYKDKLTHSGAIGGVELSMATIEDLLEIEIPYYVRVNFNAVVKLVDAIGGITINSDVNYPFTCWTDRGCTFNPGANDVDGRCALAFARERYAYETGDRHRGENQEQVISLIINKITSSATLITNYTDILNALNGTFQTNVTTDEITSLVKAQIDEMSGWHISTANVTGSGASLPTHSYPNQNLYVMQPDMESVNKAIGELNKVLETPEE